jgi:hypothetical protein
VRVIIALFAAASAAGAGVLPFVPFTGSGQEFIKAMAGDAQGNVYVAGTTTSPDFPVRNAWQARIADAALMRSLDGGATWTPLGSPAGDVNTVQPHPIDSKIVFAAGATAIYKSTDGGGTWRTVTSWAPAFFPNAVSIAIDPASPNHVAALIPGGVASSSDGGETWSGPAALSPNVPFCGPGARLMADPLGSGALIAVCTAASISHDHGKTFSALPAPAFAAGPIAVVFDSWHAGWIYFAVSSGVQGTLYRSTDGGTTWQVRASPPSSFTGINYLAPDPDQMDTWYAVALAGLFVTHDAAGSWTQVTGPFANSVENRVAVLSRQCGAAGGIFASNRQLWSSPDYGTSWKTAPFGSVMDIAAGAGCAAYIARTIAGDAFLTKLAPDGTVVWSTFLGGSDADVPVALAVDGTGTITMMGSTHSLDFPSTAPRIGLAGTQNIFLAKFDSGGRLICSVLAGSDKMETPAALATDEAGNSYIAGITFSANFPVTAGALLTQFDGNVEGFLIKIGQDAKLVYGTYLGGPRGSENRPQALAVDPLGQILMGVWAPSTGEGSVVRVNAAGSAINYTASAGGTSAPAGGGPQALAFDAQGNLYVGGTTKDASMATAGAYVSPVLSKDCSAHLLIDPPANVFVMKLRAADLQSVYAAVIGASCPSVLSGLLVDNQGVVTIGVGTRAGFPVTGRVPLTDAACGANRTPALARLSADGSALLWSEALPWCGAPSVAGTAAGVNLFPHAEVVWRGPMQNVRPHGVR